MSRLLLVVDPQIDFIKGSLPVPGAAAAMDALAGHLADNGGRYSARLVTLDFHPANHCSFGPNGGQWPVHCLEHSQGAAIWPALEGPLFAAGQTIFATKGRNAQKEEYSIFQSPEAASVAELLRGFDQVDICGIAGDVCLLNTLMDGIKLFGPGKFNVLEQFSPSLDGGKALGDFWRRQGHAANH